MAIETAMKSSAFGFLLAKLHFQQYGARVPSAVSVVWVGCSDAIPLSIYTYVHQHIASYGEMDNNYIFRLEKS